MRESLVDNRVTAKTKSPREFAIMPDVLMISIGGRSIFDRGKSAVLPLVDEIRQLRQSLGAPPLVISVGGGTRVRHTMQIALDLGLPTGGIAQLVGAMEETNAVMLNALLAKHGSIVMQREHFWDLPLYLQSGMLPIAISTPPYHFWEPPPESEDPLPTHGSDFGVFAHAEVLGVQRIIYVKDEDGLYDRDPKVDPRAQKIASSTLASLLRNLPNDLIVDPMLLPSWQRARHVKKIQIINGLIPGELTRAVAGNAVGTVLTKDETND